MEKQICQSCGMPLGDPGMYGTDANDNRQEDYCIFCYAMGSFVEDLSLDDMIEQCADMMEMQTSGYSNAPDREQYTAHLQELLPTLKRWRKE